MTMVTMRGVCAAVDMKVVVVAAVDMKVVVVAAVDMNVVVVAAVDVVVVAVALSVPPIFTSSLILSIGTRNN